MTSNLGGTGAAQTVERTSAPVGPRVALAFATAAALVLAMLVPTTAAALEDGRRAAFAEGFETGTDTWVSGGDYGTITRVTSGTGAVVSASGAAHAVVRESQPGSGPYSRLGGYRDTWVGTWGTSLSIHLDPAWASGAGFDYSVAASDSDGLHRRDFIFHVTSDEGVLHIDASNNSDTGGAPKPVASMSDASRTVEDAGWYRFDHVFRDQDGKLAVDLVVTPVAGGDAVFSTTRTTELDDIAAVGGNRYAWFTLIEVIDGLAIDDHVRWVTEGGLDAVNGAATTTTMMELIRTHREVLGLDAASLARHDALPLGQGRQQAVAAALVGAKLLVGGSYTTLAQVREVFDFAAAEEHTKFELINAIDQATAVAEIAEGLSTHAGPLAAMRRHSVQTFRDAGLTAQANELESNNYARMVFRLADASPSLVTTVAEGLLAARGSGKFLGVVQIADAAMALPVMQPVQVLRGGDVVAGHGSIQSAVSAAVAGDAITVAAGTYLENVRVDHVDGVTIRAATDERPRIVGVDGNSRRRVVDIGASDVAFLGFEISGPSNYVGIAIPGTNATIVGNVISDVVTGIQTNTPSDREGGNTITGNVIDGTSVGISLQNRGSTVTDNDVVGATLEAVASSASGNTITGNRFSVAGAGKLAVAYAGATLDVARNWWGSNARPSDALLSGDVVVSPWCTTSSCVAVTDGTPPPVIAPPVTPDAPPAPPVIVPPRPTTPAKPITTPPGQSIAQPPGQGGAFIGGQPVQTSTQQVPTPPPASQRTQQDVQQIQHAISQVVGNVTGKLPANTPPPVTVENTGDGAVVNGLLAGSDGAPKSVPAENVVSVSAGNAGLIVAGADGNGDPTTLADNGAPKTTQGGSVGTVAVGFTPGSPGQVVLFSDPVVLGEFTTDADGAFKGQVTVPDWVPAGDHTLVVAGDGPDGEVTLMLGITVEGDAPFTDVAAEATHAVAIARLKSLGITQGYADGSYDPAGDIVRGQMAAFLARALDLDTDVETDLVDAVGTHGGAIAAVVAAGVANGYGDGTFRPGGTVTRGQMATFLANAAGLDSVAEGALSDVAGAHAGAINAVVAAGLASGHTDGTFRPSVPVTRAQMATFVVSLVDHLGD